MANPLRFTVFLASAISAGPLAAATPDFAGQIQPILETHCVRCHNPDKTKGGLQMHTYEALLEGGHDGDTLIPGDVAGSQMLVRVHLRPIDEGVMPDEGPLLQPEEVALLDAWVAGGAPWPEGVTLSARQPEKPKRVAMPDRTPVSPAEAAEMMDDILRRENEGAKLVTTEPVDDLAFLRRASIDLIGRIPTMKEIREFESWGSDRREKLVDKLIEDPRFADRWTIFFADMLRIRSNVTGGNQLLAYIHGSIQQEKPYDTLVRELIAASGRADSNPAVGFILGDDANPMELAAATSQTFLGVRIGCAMCHDHPFDDWEQRDFYDLAAFFGKTKKVEGRQNNRMVYTTEGDKMTVLWPPEDKAEPEDREAIRPKFPFELVEFEKTPDFITRFEKSREKAMQAEAANGRDDSLDALLDAVEPTVGRKQDPVLAEAEKESRALDVHGDIYKASELRARLADLITDPRNGYFAPAFVNRVWAELIGRGFVEPLDNFSPYNAPHHITTLDFISREFIASGYDFKALIRLITLSDAYRRDHLDAEVPLTVREESEKNFAAAPLRRMLGEVLYDSIVVAGHLEDHKWPAGANEKQITREVRVPTGEYMMVEADDPPPSMMQAEIPATRGDGYDLESSLSLDFNSILSAEEQTELETMRQMSDEKIKQAERMAIQQEQQRRVMKYTTETVTETIDDNPRFDSAMRMATPAPPAHFLRVFGQPERAGLGEFRDPSSSLRQQLMMLNGRMTHEASRVGPLEPLHKILEKDPGKAIDWAYQEILTRPPTDQEKAEALAVLADDKFQGMSDLRWALLNSNEFRFLP